MATGTACFVPALPPPSPLSIQRSLSVIDDEDKRLIGVQHKIEALSKRNAHQLRHSPLSRQPDTLIKYFPDVMYPSRPPPPLLDRPDDDDTTTTSKVRCML